VVEVPTRDLVLALLLAVVVACALTLVAVITAVMEAEKTARSWETLASKTILLQVAVYRGLVDSQLPRYAGY
jgi:hypothetical protein